MPDLLANRIEELRRARGLSVKELAERAGFSAPYVSQMSLGVRNISLKNLNKLAAVLECQVEDLIGPSTSNSQVLDLWAAIPVERRNLALEVLRCFATPDPTTRRSND